MEVAEIYSRLSYANRLKVGAIVVKDNRVISIGYNGTPSGWDNACEDLNNKTKDEVIHAEANAISKLASNVESGVGASMFVTHAPCIECSKLIYGAGITHVYYRNQYRNDLGLNFLKKCEILTEKV